MAKFEDDVLRTTSLSRFHYPDEGIFFWMKQSYADFLLKITRGTKLVLHLTTFPQLSDRLILEISKYVIKLQWIINGTTVKTKEVKSMLHKGWSLFRVQVSENSIKLH